MRTKRTIVYGRRLVLIVAGLLLALSAQDARAQRPAHYYPARPTFSPYLLYNQVNLTGIPNYYTYVQPATQYRDYLTRIQPPASRADLRQTLVDEGEVARLIQKNLRERQTTGIGAPSVSASYGNYSHFYTPGRRRR